MRIDIILPDEQVATREAARGFLLFAPERRKTGWKTASDSGDDMAGKSSDMRKLIIRKMLSANQSNAIWCIKPSLGSWRWSGGIMGSRDAVVDFGEALKDVQWRLSSQTHRQM